MSNAPKPLKSSFAENKGGWLIAVLTIIWFSVTAIFVWSCTPDSQLVVFQLTPSHTIVAVRSLSEVLSLLLSALLLCVLDVVVWGMVSSKKGISISKFLTLSGSTGFTGLWTLIYSWGGEDWGTHRPWAVARLYPLLFANGPVYFLRA